MKTNLVRFKSDTGTWQGKLTESNVKVEHLNKRIEEQETLVELHVKEAEELSSRDLYPDPRPMSQVEEELIEVQTLLEKAEEMGGGNPLELEATINQRVESYERSKLECDIADSTARDSVNRKIIMDLLLNSARTMFMSDRQFLFLTPLDCSILDSSTDLTIHNSQRKETSSLSGGEKSYTTVAFIIALWNGMAVPFFSMDEFDVFMAPLDCSILDSSTDLTIH
ncbi:structural maintenance of chromosomes protein 6-like, partial [Diaphorina citri]|uniref:Structural maintenance of chromosomes protein 6-like n=1 Tax=Diaphorina citri TaxID=121845 RepID=A0A3Q0JFQ5_DIACI